MRKPFAIAISLALLLSFAACNTPTAPATEVLTFTDVTGAWFTEEQPEGSGSEIGPETLRVGRTYDGKDIFALVRAPFDGEFSAEAVRQAWLCLKIAENNGGSSPYVAPLTGPWERGIACGEAKALAGPPEAARQALTMDGWLQVDMTDFVRAWVGGEENYGIALFEGNDSTETVFVSGGEDGPKLEIIIDKR